MNKYIPIIIALLIPLASFAQLGNTINTVGGNQAMTAPSNTVSSSTNGAVWVATNSVGQGKWVVYPKISAYSVAGQNFGTFGGVYLVCATVDQQIGGVWDGTNWTPGVIGWVSISASLQFGVGQPAGTIWISIKRNSQTVGRSTPYYFSGNYPSFGVSAIDYCGNVTNRYSIYVEDMASTGQTNLTGLGATYFQGMVVP